MSHAIDSKSAAALLIDPMNAPEPSAADGPGSHFGSTFAPASEINGITATSTGSSNNPYRQGSIKKSPPPRQFSPPTKSGTSAHVRAASGGSPRLPSSSSPRPEKFPNYRAELFSEFDTPSNRSRSNSHGTPPSYQEAISSSPGGGSPRASSSGGGGAGGHRRRTSSLKARFPGDESTQPLDIIRRDSRKAYRSPHLRKKTLPGADSIDRLDPAVGGRAYHHEGPYDAALLSRNRDPRHAPLDALKDSNAEALRATPAENIKDSVERHRPLDGIATVAPGETDRFGRRYNYIEGADLMHDPSSGDPGYKRWADREYDPEDLKGESEPTFSLDRALRAHKITDNDETNGIELQDRSRISRDYHAAERAGDLDRRDPVAIAGGESRYVDLEIAAAGGAAATSSAESHVKRNSLGGTIKKRIGSLRKKDRED